MYPIHIGVICGTQLEELDVAAIAGAGAAGTHCACANHIAKLPLSCALRPLQPPISPDHLNIARLRNDIPPQSNNNIALHGQ